MILTSTHLFPLFSMMQQSSDQSDIPFWIIPTIIFAALLLIVVLSIIDEVDEEDAAHDGHDAHGAEAVNEPVVETKGGVLDLEEVEKAAAEKVATEKAAAEKAAAEKVAAEKAAAEVKEVVPDNLRKIEGIGPKIAGILNDDGIFTFAQLAAATVPHLEKVVREDAGIRIAHPGTWPEQAQLAADENWNELETLQDNLKGGRRVQ